MKTEKVDSDDLSDEDKRLLALLDKHKKRAGSKPGMTKRIVHATKAQLRGLVPDEDDKKNIQELIKTYNIAFPYPNEESIQLCIEIGKKETKRGFAKRKQATKRLVRVTTLPPRFVDALKLSYPVIFSDKGQFDWFFENFPEYDLRI